MTTTVTPSTMRGARVASDSSRALEIAELPVPQPREGRVRVRVEASGICHSDPLVLAHCEGASWPTKGLA
jgi:propanol-preferring alcohol dehydrogenase